MVSLKEYQWDERSNIPVFTLLASANARGETEVAFHHHFDKTSRFVRGMLFGDYNEPELRRFGHIPEHQHPQCILGSRSKLLLVHLDKELVYDTPNRPSIFVNAKPLLDQAVLIGSYSDIEQGFKMLVIPTWIKQRPKYNLHQGIPHQLTWWKPGDAKQYQESTRGFRFHAGYDDLSQLFLQQRFNEPVRDWKFGL